jgi:hypothetical protein
MTTTDIDTELKQAMIAWAQQQLDTMPQSEYGNDWWGAYNNEWDINIWDSEQLGNATYEQPTRVTAYRLTIDGRTDYGSFIGIGFISEPAEWYLDHSCNECGEPMSGKGEGTRPTRYAEGYAHGQCVLDAENFLNKSK